MTGKKNVNDQEVTTLSQAVVSTGGFLDSKISTKSNIFRLFYV